MKRWYVLGTAALLGAAAQSQATLLYSFETGLEGWQGASWETGITMAQDTVGATHGSHSDRVNWAAGAGFRWLYTEHLAASVKQDFKRSTQLMIDFTILNGFIDGWFNGKFFTQAMDGGWEWLESPAIPNWGGTAGLHTATFDITSLATAMDTNRDYRFGFAINANATQDRTFYMDNIRTDLVPEPATLAVLGLGAAVLLRRRR